LSASNTPFSIASNNRFDFAHFRSILGTFSALLFAAFCCFASVKCVFASNIPTKARKGKRKKKESQRARARERSQNETIIALARKEKNEKMDEKERARARERERERPHRSFAGIFFFKISFSLPSLE